MSDKIIKNETASARNSFRRSVTLNSLKPKGFLRIVREKVRKETEIVYLEPLSDVKDSFVSMISSPMHNYSKSRSKKSFEASPVSPGLKYIDKPLGDF